MILGLIGNYETLKSFKIQSFNDDGTVEKLIRKFSANILILFSSIFLIALLVGKRIQCWCPTEYSDQKCEYATTHCYITEFYVPMSNSSNLPNRDYLRSHKIIYYQWIPFIFFFQAVIFYIPSLVWRWLYSKSGFDIDDCVKRLENDSSDQNESKDIIFVTNEIEKKFLNKSIQKSKIFNGGFYLTICYLFTKYLYILSIYFQFTVLNKWFIDDHYNTYDDHYLYGLFNLENRFPHMTLCKFEVFILNYFQIHWMQCVLPLNVYLRKTVIIIYVWLIVLVGLIVKDIISFGLDLLNRKKFFLSLIKEENRAEKSLNDVVKYLNFDTFFLLNLLASNTNQFYASAIATNLYNNKIKAF